MDQLLPHLMHQKVVTWCESRDRYTRDASRALYRQVSWNNAEYRLSKQQRHKNACKVCKSTRVLKEEKKKKKVGCCAFNVRCESRLCLTELFEYGRLYQVILPAIKYTKVFYRCTLLPRRLSSNTEVWTRKSLASFFLFFSEVVGSLSRESFLWFTIETIWT